MVSSGFSLSVVVFLGFFGTQLGFCGRHDNSPKNFITWEDMRVEDQWGSLRLQNGFNTSRVIIVSKDGRGDSNTVQGAVDLVSQHNSERVKILILPGTYRSNTIVANGGRGMQAVALRIAGDKAMFYRVRFLGAQDTLLDLSGTHYFYQCYIQGTVDFIFGNARSLYQGCIIHSTAKRTGAIAAHHRDSEEENTGFSFVNCTVNGTGRNYLGRAWGRYSRAIYSHCNFANIIKPSGWSDWGDESRRRTAVFGEYQCRGRGAYSKRRASWAKSFSNEEARPFLDKIFIDGNQWLRL
ncbi:hypothetical protein HHK36_002248 [Tetracentron sinense]|uniref:Pectinesterase n=1 Tax=Tetracentron sinense TaxID=13715 RepID=A0A834ZZJ1_TETSI|nr:hypothetical protein HHK36_002248 [Tetracentron sinense]